MVHRITVTRLCNPLREQPWLGAGFTAREVHEALRSDQPGGTGSEAAAAMDGCGRHGAGVDRAAVDPLARPECSACELGRVVALARELRRMPVPGSLPEAVEWAQWWLAVSPEPHPVTVDVGVGAFVPPWLICDGNHRVAAATAVNWPWLVVGVAGDWDRAVGLLVDGLGWAEALTL